MSAIIPVKADDWAKMVEATKVAADLLVENKRLKDENELLRKDYESILNDRNLLWRDYKDSKEAYERLHHSFMCLNDAAKEGRDAK